ncbi:hypothetical protein WUBG_00079 [Wuchereria bancrofti]|uniref:Uncharacterized protein n=1 Tax=Wuchereria bancrofti TaxID=6293 RepID=J9FH86_WUCBA|nr:hypothetical protein WUBG_00079 [Wuchereria bancrofti]VDM16881.1 unnamed protein product [Wuchereria bancrofti]
MGRAEVEELFGVATDLMTYALPWVKCGDTTKKKDLMAAFETQHLISTFRWLEDILVRKGTGYFAGENFVMHFLSP